MSVENGHTILYYTILEKLGEARLRKACKTDDNSAEVKYDR